MAPGRGTRRAIRGTNPRGATKHSCSANLRAGRTVTVVMGTQAGILTRWLALLVVALPVAAGEPVAADVRACVGGTDATRRLACYDREVGKTVSAEGTELFGADGALLQKLVADGSGPRQPKEIT